MNTSSFLGSILKALALSLSWVEATAFSLPKNSLNGTYV